MIFYLIPLVSLTFTQMKHPLSMSVLLLAQTTLIALATGTLSFNLWFSYIMFLIMIGGMLVLFIYMTSIASNEKFSFKLTDLTAPFMGGALIITGLSLSWLQPLTHHTEIWEAQGNILLTKYLNFPINFIIILMMIYLLIALIAVVNISSINHGPLRQKF
uniref:NADH-ubiquinone oxidoreductase chain 6 n=1 Tax=Margarinotus merdarius TaxID=878136 RepID=A0A0S2M7K9_MARMD|nr:NADH dehydrogenase subunit 6 [Margarinotus merdarius]ALO70688.1 NADH deshydrogenase subunit 6 [Margarinotus merdarius]